MYSNEAVNLVEQVLNEGRFKDTYIGETRNRESDLDVAIANNDINKVNNLIKQYKKAKEFLAEAKTKKKTKNGNHYWTLPNWIIFLLFTPVAGAAINTLINSGKTKYSDEEIGKMEEAIDRCIAKAEAFIRDKANVKHEAAYILIEALNTLLNE